MQNILNEILLTNSAAAAERSAAAKKQNKELKKFLKLNQKRSC